MTSSWLCELLGCNVLGAGVLASAGVFALELLLPRDCSSGCGHVGSTACSKHRREYCAALSVSTQALAPLQCKALRPAPLV
jgi:hypothetical protein